MGNNLWVVPKHFSDFPGLRQADDDECSGRPVSSSTPEMIERVRQIIREDRRCTIDKVSMLVGIIHGTCHKILTEDLKMRRVASKFVPRFLSVDQKQQRLDVCLDLKENAANDPSFLSNVIRVTKPGFTSTTRKQKLNPVNEKVRGHLDRRRQGK